jgi:hypothetical protein
VQIDARTGGGSMIPLGMSSALSRGQRIRARSWAGRAVASGTPLGIHRAPTYEIFCVRLRLSAAFPSPLPSTPSRRLAAGERPTPDIVQIRVRDRRREDKTNSPAVRTRGRRFEMNLPTFRAPRRDDKTNSHAVPTSAREGKTHRDHHCDPRSKVRSGPFRSSDVRAMHRNRHD